MMKRFLFNILIAILNLLSLGLGFAVSGNLRKAFIIQFIACLIFAIGGITNLFSSFYGMLSIYVIIAAVYFYAVVASLINKNIVYHKWLKNIFLYILFSFVVKMSLVFPVKQFLYEPLKMNENFDNAIKQGEYLMIDKKTPQENISYIIVKNDDGLTLHKNKKTTVIVEDDYYAKPLYIFWSNDMSRIGHIINQ